MTRPQAFLFTYAGGGQRAYARLYPSLRVHRDVVTVDAFDNAADSATGGRPDAYSVVERGLDAVLVHRSEHPFQVFGHSLGAVVAAGVVSALLRTGQARGLAKVSLSACLPPHRLGELEQRMPSLAAAMAGRETSAAEHRDAIVLPRHAVEQVLAFAGFEVAPGAFGDVPFETYAGSVDTLARSTEMVGWRRHGAGPFTEHVFEGGHFYFRKHARLVAQALCAQVPPGADANRD